MNRICVFCGSSQGHDPIYMQAATELGKTIAQRGYGLVYGGASIGTMGAVADAVIANGGEVIGVIPQSISDMEVAHQGLSQLDVVADMHARKARMMSLSDAFIAMPGGLGTLEEIFEALTWLQLGFHQKPCALLNTESYYDHLIAFLLHAESQGFVKQAHVRSLLIAKDSNELLSKLQAFRASSEPKLNALGAQS